MSVIMGHTGTHPAGPYTSSSIQAKFGDGRLNPPQLGEFSDHLDHLDRLAAFGRIGPIWPDSEKRNWDVLENPSTIPDDEDLDYLDIKVGEAIYIDARCASYAKCDGEEIIWCFYYPTSHPKLIGSVSLDPERLTHLTLAYISAK
ncbi:hypothetical protein B0H10DRAFT_2194612 [Mycena sp. CBHHK59/15]|nr:hypothetical protein B0H10DRAFT_2194612 [Mycena sp. CBHHK59/15]